MHFGNTVYGKDAFRSVYRGECGKKADTMHPIESVCREEVDQNIVY